MLPGQDMTGLDGVTDSVSQVCGGIYRKTSDYVTHLIRQLSSNQDIVIPEGMSSSSFSSEFSSSSAMSICTDSRTSSSSECQDNIDNSHQPPLRSLHRRSTSLIERKQATPVKTRQVFNETGSVNVIADNFFHLNHAATTYLDNYMPISDITNIRLPSSASALQLPSTTRSTPNISRSSTRTNSHCSCFACSNQGM